MRCFLRRVSERRKQLPVCYEKFLGRGGLNRHEAIAPRGADAIIPTRKNAKPWQDKRPGAAERHAILNAARRLGRKIWRKWSGYHRGSLVETKMHYFKLLDERVMARGFDRQVAELQVRAAILNRFRRLGTPTTVPMP